MSAYIVSKNHVLYLVMAAESRSIGLNGCHPTFSWRWGNPMQSGELHISEGHEKLADVANMLWRENMASVGDLYAGSSASLPGPVGGEFVVTGEDFRRVLWDSFTAAQVFKACDCFEYQSCEHDGWRASEAHAFISALRAAAWHSLPGYEGAEWGAPKTLAEKTAADLAGEKRAAVVNLAATTAARETVEKIQSAAFIAAFGSGAEITIEPGQMAVVAELNYDNSDSMTDYFDRHCGIGPGFVLAVGKSGRETEARARAAVALYPELAGVQFAWKTEKWSMGHGNYLEAESGFVKLTPEMAGNRSIYRGGEVTAARWEITFRKAHSAAETLPAFKGYPNGQPSAPSVPSASGEAAPAIVSAGVIVRRNTEKGGIEIVFPSKPAPTILEKLKAAGWRWSRFAACWWIKASDDAEKFAQDIARGMTGGATI